MPLMAQSVFDYLVSGSYNEVKVAVMEIADPMIRFIVENVYNICDRSQENQP